MRDGTQNTRTTPGYMWEARNVHYRLAVICSDLEQCSSSEHVFLELLGTHRNTYRNKGIPSAPADAPLVVWPR